MVDIIKFIKLMELTTSSYDGEALNALRKANAELFKYNLTWNQFLSNKQIIITNPIQNQPKPDIDLKLEKHKQTERMLSTCLQCIHSESGLEFIRSLKKQFDSSGYLTDRQLEALCKWYNNF